MNVILFRQVPTENISKENPPEGTAWDESGITYFRLLKILKPKVRRKVEFRRIREKSKKFSIKYDEIL